MRVQKFTHPLNVERKRGFLYTLPATAVLAVVVGLMSGAAWAGDIVTQQDVQSVSRSKLNDLRKRTDADLRKRHDVGMARATSIMEAVTRSRQESLEAAKASSIDPPKGCVYDVRPGSSYSGMLASIMHGDMICLPPTATAAR